MTISTMGMLFKLTVNMKRRPAFVRCISAHEIFETHAALKFHSHGFRIQGSEIVLVSLVFVFDSCFPDHGVPFSLGYASCLLVKGPPRKEQCTLRPRPKPRGQASHKEHLPPSLSSPLGRRCKRTITDAP
jgi:hypothetical protein